MPVKVPGPRGGEPVEIVGVERRPAEQLLHHHGQALGLAGLHRLESAPQRPVTGTVIKSGGTRLKRRVEAEDDHS